jgi:hypothetical protein
MNKTTFQKTKKTHIENQIGNKSMCAEAKKQMQQQEHTTLN